MTATATDRRELAEWTVGEASEAARQHPRRHIVIDLGDTSMSFASLAGREQRTLESEFGARAAALYEAAVAEYVGRVVNEIDTERIGVLGLPVEPGVVGDTAARRANRLYGGTLAKLDPIVSAHLFLLRGTTLTEEQLVQTALLEAIRRAKGRPILFRTNGRWRILIDTTALERDRADDRVARWDRLLAETPR